MSILTRKNALDLDSDLWKHILSFSISNTDKRDEHVNLLIKLSIVCKSSANFVRSMWSHDPTFYEFVAQWDHLRFVMDPFNSRKLSPNPYTTFSRNYERDDVMSQKTLRALATLSCTNYCSLCNNHFPSYEMKNCMFMGKVMCSGCITSSFVTYKELYLKYNVDLSITLQAADENANKTKKRRVEECLLAFYFRQGGFGLRYSTGGLITKEKINSQFCADEFSHVIFKGPAIILWRPDVYRILNISKFGMEKRRVEDSAKVLRDFIRRKLNEITLIGTISANSYFYAVQSAEDRTVWKDRIIRNIVFARLSRPSKHIFYSRVMERERGFNIFNREKTMERDFYQEHAKCVYELEMPEKKLMDIIGKKNHNLCRTLKPGRHMKVFMEKCCCEILNYGFGMSDKDFLSAMELLMESMETTYAGTTWAIC